MPNILTEQFPDAVLIDEQPVKINTDFRVCLRVILAFEDEELTQYEKQMVLLSALYPEMPENFQVALKQATKFLNGGKGGEDSEDEIDMPMRLYSFEKDANLIFAAFRQTHGIDLETAELHWWKFLALFMDLGSETTFCNLVSLRKRVKTGKASKEEKEIAAEMGAAFEIPELDDRTLEEKEAEMQFEADLARGKAKQ